MFELFLTSEYSILIFVDMLRGVFGTYGWGIPADWTGTWFLIYATEILCWFVFPIISMLWWRSWINKHPELAEEI
ncbi:MAG: hypothetical protein H5T33_01980 [Candidatus Methanosuratus sp.]|nr:hypothetical protein [Candidatus Methanosuratincola sp.]